MESYVGIDIHQNEEDAGVGGSGGVAAIPVALDNSSSVGGPPPSTSKKINKLSFPDTDDPKPGPSNSAAEFDLEVFDSGSSCSNEECWGGTDDKGLKKCVTLVAEHSDTKEEIALGHTNLTPVKNLPTKLCIEAESECESETEEMEIEIPGPSLEATEDVSCSSALEDQGETSKEDPLPISVLPSETIDRKESVELWKLTNETDVIVQDHDVFGTDENDEDSMDSLMLSRGGAIAQDRLGAGESSESILDSDEVLNLLPGPGFDSRASSRLSQFSAGIMDTIPPLPADHDDSTMSSETIATENNILSSDLKPTEDDHKNEILKSTENPIAHIQMTHRAEMTKRKSGSLSEIALATLPLKKQKPELSELSLGLGLIPRDHMLGGGSSCMDTSDMDTNTAPTSPVAPDSSPPIPALSPSTLEAYRECSGSLVSTVGMIPRPEGSPPLGRNLIPDKENPPQEILNWVATFTRWSHAERLLAIDHLIDTCEPQQVRHMMQVIEPQFQRDFISLLPKELALYVLNHLDPRDLLRAAQTCRYWRILAEDNLLWREKCKEAGLPDCRENLRRKSKISSNFIYSPWKAGFMRQHNIEMNWRVNPVKAPKVLKGHDDHVITCLQFCGNRVVSGSDDNTLKVWSAMTGKCLRTLVGHTGGVWSSQMQGNIVVSGSTDRTLKVWNAESGTCVHTLYGHTSTVRCMHLHGTSVVSGSRDATLRMWNIETGECLHVLVGHVAAVRCVQYDGRLVVSGAYDYMVKVWNPAREECLHTLSGHTNRVYSLQFDGVHVVSGSLDTSIRVWDVETGACKHALMGHQSLTSGMELKDNILVSGNADSTVKIWDILTGTCLQTLSGPNKHQSAVTYLQFNQKFVITSSDDGTVKLWDVKTGEFIRDLVALESGGSGGVVWRIRSNATKLVCAVGSRNGTEETKLLVLDFDSEVKCF